MRLLLVMTAFGCALIVWSGFAIGAGNLARSQAPKIHALELDTNLPPQ
jgi:hypothetical protein